MKGGMITKKTLVVQCSEYSEYAYSARINQGITSKK